MDDADAADGHAFVHGLAHVVDGQRGDGDGPYRLVIWERQPGQPPTAWSAGVVFKSMGKCTRQGVKAVLRRTGGTDPYADGTRVWYECQQLTQR